MDVPRRCCMNLVPVPRPGRTFTADVKCRSVSCKTYRSSARGGVSGHVTRVSHARSADAWSIRRAAPPSWSALTSLASSCCKPATLAHASFTGAVSHPSMGGSVCARKAVIDFRWSGSVVYLVPAKRAVSWNPLAHKRKADLVLVQDDSQHATPPMVRG